MIGVQLEGVFEVTPRLLSLAEARRQLAERKVQVDDFGGRQRVAVMNQDRLEDLLRVLPSFGSQQRPGEAFQRRQVRPVDVVARQVSLQREHVVAELLGDVRQAIILPADFVAVVGRVEALHQQLEQPLRSLPLLADEVEIRKRSCRWDMFLNRVKRMVVKTDCSIDIVELVERRLRRRLIQIGFRFGVLGVLRFLRLQQQHVLEPVLASVHIPQRPQRR